MRAKPLAGITVLDLTRLLPGPLCTQHLGDMGADVIKIEDTKAGDYTRWREPVREQNSAFFLSINRNKRSVKLDLSQDAGKEVFYALAREADVIVEQFRPGVMERLKIDYETIRELNPRIVFCAISGYGQEGPYRDRAGHDINYCSYAGLSEQMGTRGGPPAAPNFQIADLAGGTLSPVMGILAALVDVQRTGEGRYVDVSMTDCTLAHCVIMLSAEESFGATRPLGEDYLTGGVPSYGIYETEDDRYISLGALEPKFWDAFCEAVERPDLKGMNICWDDESVRVRGEVAAIIKQQPQSYWAEFALRVDCCMAPVLTLAESREDPQLKARGMFVTHDHPVEGPVRQFAFPVKFSEFAFSIDREAPLYGEHSEEILEAAGYGPDQIAQLKSDGVI